MVDDFGIKYTDKADFHHLITIMQQKYTFKVDFDAKRYIGIHLDWNYDTRELICSMKGYVQQALRELEHVPSTCHQKAPSRVPYKQYGAKIQYVQDDETALLDDSKIRYIQRVIGKFLYYARAIDDTVLHALNDIASALSKGTLATECAVRHFMDYAHTHRNPDTQIIFRASNMILHTDSNTAYLVAPNARSRAGGYHYCGNQTGT